MDDDKSYNEVDEDNGDDDKIDHKVHDDKRNDHYFDDKVDGYLCDAESMIIIVMLSQ